MSLRKFATKVIAESLTQFKKVPDAPALSDLENHSVASWGAAIGEAMVKTRLHMSPLVLQSGHRELASICVFSARTGREQSQRNSLSIQSHRPQRRNPYQFVTPAASIIGVMRATSLSTSFCKPAGPRSAPLGAELPSST